MDVAN